MNELLDMIKQYDIFTVLSLGVITWYFSKQTRELLEIKIDNLDKDIRVMNIRTAHLEGTVYGKDVYKQIDDKS